MQSTTSPLFSTCVLDIFPAFDSRILRLDGILRDEVHLSYLTHPLNAVLFTKLPHSLRRDAPLLGCLISRNKSHLYPPFITPTKKLRAEQSLILSHNSNWLPSIRNRPYSFASLPFGRFANIRVTSLSQCILYFFCEIKSRVLR